MNSRYSTVYKWQKNIDDTWHCWEEEISYLDIPAWEHNGWSTVRPPEPPVEAPVRGRKPIESVTP
jgi:hypothetical protein